MSVPRLKKRAQFLAVAATKQAVRTTTMIVQMKERDDLDTASIPLRVGFTATRRLGAAVIRNRAKRRLRALVDKLAPTLALRRPVDLVLIAVPATTTAAFPTLILDFIASLKRFGILEETK